MFLFKYILLFLMFSFTGWLIEVIYVYKDQKILVNRGFLFGPYCPIYGFGSLLIILMLNKYYFHPFVVFIESIVICFIIEYLTSYVLEILFNEKWWDYNDRKYNISGRVCLETLVPFGFFSILCLYIVAPIYSSLINLLNNRFLIILASLLLILYIIDLLTSISINLKLKKINYKYDENKKLKKQVNEIINKECNKVYKRLEHDNEIK